MMRLMRLAPEDATDQEKLDAFCDRVNVHEEECVEANLIPKVDCNMGPDGAVVVSFQYAVADVMRNGQLRGALREEVLEKLERAKRARVLGS